MALPTIGGGNLTSQDVLAYAQRIAETGQDVGVNMCQRFVRMAFGSSGGASTAVDAWRQTPDKHTNGTPPPGTAVYWGGGAGHAAISAGNGWVYTTDWSEAGKVSLARIDDITNKWGKPLLGWTTQTNERKITRLNAKPVEGVGGKGDPTYSGNVTTAGGGVNTTYSPKELAQRYGYASQFFQSSPELTKLLARAAKAQWTPDEFQHRFMASRWYRQHTEAEQQWALLAAQKPAEAQDTLVKKRAEIVNLYRQMGVPVAPDRVDKITKAAVVHGWSQQQVQNALTAEFDYQPDNTYGGVVGQTVDQFRQQAAAYVTPLSNKTIEKWTENVLRGDATPDDFTSYLKAQAKSQWDDPGLSAAIDKGLTVDDYLSPYRETAARELGINPSSVDWLDSKWGQGIFQTDDKGARKVMSLADWTKTLRTDSRFGYDSTAPAIDAASQFAGNLAKMFGKAA